MGMQITKEMKEAGARILFRELGFQFTPDNFIPELVSEAIFLAMLSASPEITHPIEDREISQE